MYFLKVWFVCVLSDQVNPHCTASLWYYSWLLFTQIPHPLHLCHNYFHYQPALPVAFNQLHSAVCRSQQSPQKSNPLPLLMGCDIALIIFSAVTAAECGKQAVDTPLLLRQLFHSNTTLFEWILSNDLITFINYSVLILLSPSHLPERWNISLVVGAKWYSLVLHTFCMCAC